ncbi:MAG: nucleoside 2-deoxyribosyltransferase [Victivallaceae bacterium]|jgi:nucleoside 2-deoxyribosyltransferase
MRKFIVFFAGELFDHKHLTGNQMLAMQIGKVANGRFECFLPQDMDTDGLSFDEIRRKDLNALFNADLALFNFDGGDADSGTVAEFIAAKSINKPAVLFRSDFRSAGDQEQLAPWNLMCSGYPNTETLVVNSMQLYKSLSKQSPVETIEAVHRHIAELLVDKFNAVLENAVTPAPEVMKSLRKSFALD